MSTVSTFVNVRRFTYALVGLSAVIVLGFAAHFAALFLPHINRTFTIFSLIVPSVTIVTFLIISGRSRPVIDLILLFALAVLWLAMAAWSSDVIGHVECFGLTGTQPTKSGTMSAQAYCYEMKTIEALSWANFGILSIAFVILVILINQLASYGQFSSNTGFNEMPWFGQQMYGGGYGGYGGGGGGYPQQQMMFQGNGQQPYVIQQAPGHSVMIQPQPNGMPIVQQMPGNVA